MPKVSVIMGIYNCADTLSEAIESIINQTFKDWEVIMCDDGSLDRTLEIAQMYAQKYDNIKVYSFLFFLISFHDVNSIRSKVIVVALTLIYIYLIIPTDSRSCTWFAIIAVLFALSIFPRNIILKTDSRLYLWLLIPLLVALVVVIISQGTYMQQLDLWSLQKFKKPIFNGRDEIWENGLNVLFNNLLFGRGNLEGNWHNCIITVLTAYGIIGSTLWVMAFQRILSRGRLWLRDSIVVGCIITFLMMYIQQSVELGLICEAPNLLPYIVLGVMLGRIKYLRENSIQENMGL